MMREAKRLGYHVITNTTVYKETEIAEVEELCEFLTRDVDVDGMLISPGYQYESVEESIFLTGQDIERKFKRVLELSDRYKFTSTPMFLEFAAGSRDYACSPWSTVTFTPMGWKGPCYLIQKTNTFDWDEFWNGYGLELLGIPIRSAVHELQDALGLRGVRGHRAAEKPA